MRTIVLILAFLLGTSPHAAAGQERPLVKRGTDFTRRKFEVARAGEGWEQLERIMRVMTYDPVPALENLRIPILALWGDKDTYVPVPETVTIFKRAMARAGNRAYTAKVYPGCSHSLLLTPDGSPSTGGTERSFVPGLWKMEADWVLEHIGPSGPSE